MADFPRNLGVPTHINPWLRWSIGTLAGRLSSIASPGGGLTWSANVAIYVPFLLDWPYDVRRMFWANGNSTGGNSDVGLYTLGGARLYSSGSVANSGSGAAQYVTPAADLLLQPGMPYFMAFAHDSSTGSQLSGGSGTTMTTSWGRACGLYQQSSAFPLPLTATFAAYAAVGIPLIGFTNLDSGF